MRFVWSAILVSVALFVLAMVYVQGSRLWPNFRYHLFYEVRLDKEAGSPDYGIRPFLSDGEHLSLVRKIFYRWALAKFPTKSSCLTAEKPNSLNHSRVDWSQIRTPQQLEVCLYHMATAAGSITKFQNWLDESRISATFLSVDYSTSKLSATFVERYGEPHVSKRDFVVASFSEKSRNYFNISNVDEKYLPGYLIAGHSRRVYVSIDAAGQVEYIKQEQNWF